MTAENVVKMAMATMRRKRLRRNRRPPGLSALLHDPSGAAYDPFGTREGHYVSEAVNRFNVSCAAQGLDVMIEEDAVVQVRDLRDVLNRTLEAYRNEAFSRLISPHKHVRADFVSAVSAPELQARVVSLVLREVGGLCSLQSDSRETAYLVDQAPNVLTMPDDVETADGRFTQKALSAIQTQANKDLKVITSVEIEPF